MNVKLLLLLPLFLFSTARWHYNLEDAKQLAKKEHKHILLNFSGSDWCGPAFDYAPKFLKVKYSKKWRIRS